MPNQLSNTVGNLINNSNPLPDATVESYNIVTIAAAGTTQPGATAITSPVAIISNNTAANGAILPVGTIDQRVVVYPALATNAPKIYPPVGGTINGGSLNASVANTAQKAVEYIAIDSTGLNWITLGL